MKIVTGKDKETMKLITDIAEVSTEINCMKSNVDTYFEMLQDMFRVQESEKEEMVR